MGSHETQERKSEAIEELLCNRTGIMTNPELSVELIEGAKNTIPSSRGNGELAASGADYLNEALPIGSPPLSCLEVREAEQVPKKRSSPREIIGARNDACLVLISVRWRVGKRQALASSP